MSAPPSGIPPSRDYDLVVEIERFEGDDQGEVVLAARWQPYRPESSVPILSREGCFVQKGWTYRDEGGQARMLDLDVEELATQIGTAVRRGMPGKALPPVAAIQSNPGPAISDA